MRSYDKVAPKVNKKIVEANESEKQKEYAEFFQKMLKDFGVKSPSELSGEKKKEFFNRIEKEWTGDTNESKEEYQAFFKKMLKDFGVNSPSELSDEKKKEFFNRIEKEWTGDTNESFKPKQKVAVLTKDKKKIIYQGVVSRIQKNGNIVVDNWVGKNKPNSGAETVYQPDELLLIESESLNEDEITDLRDFFNKNKSHFGAFVKSGLIISIRPSGSLFIGGKKSEFAIKVNPDTKTIETWGKPSGRSSTSYVEIMEYLKHKLPKYKIKEISDNVELFNESKATNLNEGQFSWMTQDTRNQIGSERENTIEVYMWDNKGNSWFEDKYEGYGVFGGKDYYDLLAEMNGYTEADTKDKKLRNELRLIGIDLAFDKLKTRDKGRKTLYPALVENHRFNWKRHDFTQEPDSDPNQSWYTPDEDEEYWESKTNEANAKAWVKKYAKNVERGYGWVDPEKVLQDVWYDFKGSDNEQDRRDIYDYLIKQRLLYFAGEDPEEKGPRITKINQITDMLQESDVSYSKGDRVEVTGISSLDKGAKKYQGKQGTVLGDEKDGYVMVKIDKARSPEIEFRVKELTKLDESILSVNETADILRGGEDTLCIMFHNPAFREKFLKENSELVKRVYSTGRSILIEKESIDIVKTWMSANYLFDGRDYYVFTSDEDDIVYEGRLILNERASNSIESYSWEELNAIQYKIYPHNLMLITPLAENKVMKYWKEFVMMDDHDENFPDWLERKTNLPAISATFSGMKVLESKDDLEKMDDDPCWDGYVMAGMKMKDGKEVPNCVPIDESEVNNKEEFAEMAKKMLKKAHGEDYDEEKAKATIDGLADKYGDDWGAAVGALTSGLS